MLNHTPFKLLPEMADSWLKRAGYFHHLLTLMILLSVGTSLSLQSQEFRASGDIAMSLFSSGKYNEAIDHFEVLAVQYPDDPLYKYYYGRTLLELDKDHEKAVSLLEAAVKGSTGLRPVPADARFWLGRACHRAGMFDRAVDYYDIFSAGARRKDVRRLKVAEYSGQASRGLGAAEKGMQDEPAERPVTEITGKVVAEVPVKGVTEATGVKKGMKDNVVEKEEKTEPAVVADDYDSMAKNALALQFSADSVNRLANRYRGRLSSLAGTERASVEEKILSLERMGFKYQAKADTLFNQLTGRVDASALTPAREKAVAADTLLPGEKGKVSVTESDQVVQVDNKWIGKPGQDQKDSIQALISPEKEAADPVLMVFRSDANSGSVIQINPEMPEGLVYRVQIAAFRNPVAASYFKTFSPAYGIRAEDSDITFYYIGMFRKKSDADRAVAQLRSAGFSDAFVVPVNNGVKVSLERAAEMEKEWGTRSLLNKVEDVTEPSTLVYRVEAARVSRELKGDDAEAIKRVAGNRGLDIITDPDGTIVYLIGKFLTFESASGYADLIFRNGIGGAKVVAYLGNREIPLEKARELFELYNK